MAFKNIQRQPGREKSKITQTTNTLSIGKMYILGILVNAF